ncbi:MAG: cytochrome c biogenesis protein ResB [Verrucomicrobiota bacterium]
MPAPAPRPEKPAFPKRVWNYLTSFQLAVLILGLSILLVFLGTLAQVHEGLYLAQSRWFKSWFVIRQSGDPWWVLPAFPGGYLLGTIFLVNMLGAHFRRLKYPPGGLVGMTVHYAVVMAALFFITKSLLWLPFYFAMAQVVLIAADLALCMVSKRFESSGRKIGIDLVHLGIAVLLLGQLSTDLFARETHLAFREGETKHYSESHMETELAIVRSVDDKTDEVTAIPEDLLKETGKNLNTDKLPFSVQVKQWMANSDLVDRKECVDQQAALSQALATLESKYSLAEQLPGTAAEALTSPGRRAVWEHALQSVGEPAGADPVESAKRIAADPGKATTLLSLLKSKFRKEMLDRFRMQGGAMAFAAAQTAAGKTLEEGFPKPQASTPVAERYFTVPLPETRAMDTRNVPSAVVELTARDGTSMGSFLLTPQLKEQKMTILGQEYSISLRLARAYHTFAMTLLKTTHDKYPGTDMPKDFRSRVRIQEDNKQGDRETEIFMNSPLRFENGNLTFFQSQMGRDQTNAAIGTSSLQVVRNPGWFSPYFGCALVAYGMCRHFLLHLGRFISRKKAS